MKWDKYISVIGFLGVIFFVAYLQLSRKNLEGKKIKETQGFPTFENFYPGTSEPDYLSIKSNFRKLVWYKDEVDTLYKKRFTLESDFFDAYRYFESNLFAINPIPNKVLEGDDDYLFLGDDFSMAFSESKGYDLFRGGHFKLMDKQVFSKQRWLKERGIAYYIAIAPNKLTIYDEKIPIRKGTDTTKRVQTVNYFNSKGFSIIDLSDTLIKQKEKGLYFKTDTHWNELGAYYAYCQLLTAIKKDFPQVRMLSEADFTVEPLKYTRRDLARMLRTQRREEAPVLHIKSPKGKKVASELCIPDFYNQDPLRYEYRYKSNVNNLKILVLGDSFGTWWQKFLKESFGEVVIIRQNRFEARIIEQEQPDIVVNEYVERGIEELMVRPVEPIE
ncbi:MAG: hypothetical protein CL596_10800 [Alteromonas sp.]|nr:hypothetical protein [Alteromonas sp.]MAY21924.1 hypothetical protein [Flavobacteriaceae bacterium]|tara:strand:+ start:125329 stop:126489 length:1161 start_codon:yes stop_codon:yes gene_type:complete